MNIQSINLQHVSLIYSGPPEILDCGPVMYSESFVSFIESQATAWLHGSGGCLAYCGPTARDSGKDFWAGGEGGIVV